jgi:hypothetical protein
MPVPLVPIAVAGGLATAVWAALRTARPGRTDQRAEDALDEAPEGLALHAPADRPGQRNAAFRLTRRITIGARTWTIDAGLIARLKVERVG